MRKEAEAAGLAKGDKDKAEQAFDAVADNAGKAVALAAYQSGQLAEGRLDYTKAMRQYKKAVALEEDNPDYLLAAGRMALSLADYSHSQEWLKRLLRIREKEKKEDTELALVLDRLATLHQYQGNYKPAEQLFKRSLEIFEKSRGKDHPSVATTLNNLAALYYKQENYQKSAEMLERAIAIMKKKFPNGHPDIDLYQENYDTLKEKMANP